MRTNANAPARPCKDAIPYDSGFTKREYVALEILKVLVGKHEPVKGLSEKAGLELINMFTTSAFLWADSYIEQGSK